MSTTGSQEEADKLAGLLVSKKLAACVQILPITSYYNWEGKMNKDAEWLLLIKTRLDCYPEIENFIQANHSYEVPELLEIPVNRGLESYLGWIDHSLSIGG
jgi:periplasmic divalent cation tolerance protein